MAQNIQIVRDAPSVGRKLRQPRHTFNVRALPWQIQPFMLAPVLPGETMKSALMQGICRGAPLRSDQLGWWFETYIFYVKHRDLKARDLLTDMHLNPAADLSSLRSPAKSDRNYCFPGGVDYTALCLEAVTREYFRDEDEGYLDGQIDGHPIANMNNMNAYQSAVFSDQMPQPDHLIPGEVQQLPDQGIPAGFEAAYEQWQHMRSLQLYEATFEDYLKSFGVSPPRELKVQEIHRPELLRYVRDWGYPQVKYDVDTAAVAPQMIHNISERADKDRFFAEPGFIFGVCVARPKVYLGSLRGPVAHAMDNAYSWLPAVLQDEPYTSLRKFAPGTGPTDDQVNKEYWIDLRDLFVHGDQFRNWFDLSDIVGLVDAYGELNAKFNSKYASKAALDNFFKDPAKAHYRWEGVATLNILSRISDTTP